MRVEERTGEGEKGWSAKRGLQTDGSQGLGHSWGQGLGGGKASKASHLGPTCPSELSLESSDLGCRAAASKAVVGAPRLRLTVGRGSDPSS